MRGGDPDEAIRAYWYIRDRRLSEIGAMAMDVQRILSHLDVTTDSYVDESLRPHFPSAISLAELKVGVEQLIGELEKAGYVSPKE